MTSSSLNCCHFAGVDLCARAHTRYFFLFSLHSFPVPVALVSATMKLAQCINESFHIFRRQNPMNPTKMIGIILIATGCLGLAFGGFSYTKETTGMKLGPLELKVQEKQTVNVPLIVSAGGIILGVFLLMVGRK
jgi:multidrug transporter EmrE-like cation transporter